MTSQMWRTRKKNLFDAPKRITWSEAIATVVLQSGYSIEQLEGYQFKYPEFFKELITQAMEAKFVSQTTSLGLGTSLIPKAKEESSEDIHAGARKISGAELLDMMEAGRE